jgi:hypothetical protein
MTDLPAIGKDNNSNQGYQYRGIEQITAHAQPLFAKYGIVFVPKVIDRTCKEFEINKRPWTEEQLTVTYDVYGPGGVEDKIVVGPVYGLGRDNSDKGANKALTQAYKYALLQTLCISDAKDDGDQDVAHQADPTPAPVDLTTYIKGMLSADEQTELKAAWRSHFPFPARAVPHSAERNCRTLIDSFVGALDEPASTQGEERSGVAAQQQEGPEDARDWSLNPDEAPFD